MNGASLRRSDSKASTASGLEQYAERVRKDWRSQAATSDESLSFPMRPADQRGGLLWR